MTPNVVDASAVLAVLFREPGSERVAPVFPGALISAVNLSEVLARFARDGKAVRPVAARLEQAGLRVVPFDREQAEAAAALLPATRGAGLSQGDRACIALARGCGGVAWTADRAWTTLDVGVEITCIR